MSRRGPGSVATQNPELVALVERVIRKMRQDAWGRMRAQSRSAQRAREFAMQPPASSTR